MSYLLRSYIEHIKFTDLHAADPLPLITSRDIMDTKVLLLLQAPLKNFKYLLWSFTLTDESWAIKWTKLQCVSYGMLKILRTHFLHVTKLTPTLIHLSNPITDTHKVTCSNFEIKSKAPQVNKTQASQTVDWTDRSRFYMPWLTLLSWMWGLLLIRWPTWVSLMTWRIVFPWKLTLTSVGFSLNTSNLDLEVLNIMLKSTEYFSQIFNIFSSASTVGLNNTTSSA